MALGTSLKKCLVTWSRDCIMADRKGKSGLSHVVEERRHDDRDDHKIRITRNQRDQWLREEAMMAQKDDDYIEEYGYIHGRSDLHMPVGHQQRDHQAFLQGISALTINPQSAFVSQALMNENMQLKHEIHKLKGHLTNSKLETADLYSKFGLLADEWKKTVDELKKTCNDQEANYEERITALEKTNERLRKENVQLHAMVQELYKKEKVYKDQQRQLKIGQIAYDLERLVGEVVFPGDDRMSRRQRYGLQLKDVFSKISKLQDEDQKRDATSRLESIPQEIFADWVLGIIDEIKKMRLSRAHPTLGGYDEVINEIKVHYEGDDVKCEDLITIVGYLKNLYEKQQLPFGGEV